MFLGQYAMEKCQFCLVFGKFNELHLFQGPRLLAIVWNGLKKSAGYDTGVLVQVSWWYDYFRFVKSDFYAYFSGQIPYFYSFLTKKLSGTQYN